MQMGKSSKSVTVYEINPTSHSFYLPSINTHPRLGPDEVQFGLASSTAA